MDLSLFKRKQTLSDIKARKEFRSLDISTFDNKNVFLKANAGAGKTTEILNFIKNHTSYSILVVSFCTQNTEDMKNKMDKLNMVYHTTKSPNPMLQVRTFDSLAVANRGNLSNDRDYLSVHYANKHITECFRDSPFDHHRPVMDMKKDIVSSKEWSKQMYDYMINNKVKQNIHLNQLFMVEKYHYLPFDIIIVDEAQDLSSVRIKFFQKPMKQNKLKIYVGDPKQSIFYQNNVFYGKALTFTLTHTFRYGGEVVDWINIYGNKHTSFKKTKMLNESIEEYIQDKKITILISTWNQVLTYIDLFKSQKLSLSAKSKKKILSQIANHKKYTKIEDERIAYNAANINTLSKLKFFEKKGQLYLLEFSNNKWTELEPLLNNKRKRSTSIITTIHSAKGLEYKHVYLDASCYPEHNRGGWSWMTKENMFYVAITRATESLCTTRRYSPFLLRSVLENIKYDKHLLEKVIMFPNMYQFVKKELET
tara:strand:+ start:81 stop:1517 length:1437 start_codon:yes stop_codon:yes gene_type:complete